MDPTSKLDRLWRHMRDRRPWRAPVLLGFGAIWIVVGSLSELWPGQARQQIEERLTWRPPALVAPRTIVAANESPGPYGLHLTLDAGRDYIVKLGTLTSPGGLSINGGRNVVIIGGQIRVPDIPSHDGAWIGRCVTITDTTGTVHIEGVLMQNCATGVAITAAQAIVQLQNVRFEDVDAPYHLWHPDVVQTWRGPKEIRIDRLTADFSSKGFLWMSVNDTFPRLVDQRRVNFRRWTQGGARPGGPHIYTWHPSPVTRSTCTDCWSEMGWFSATGVRGLQDGWGTFDNPDGTNQFVPYLLGRGTQRVRVSSQAQHDSLRGDLGRRQGDFMERLAPSLSGERWTWGVPPRGDFVPAKSVGPSYSSPGYRAAVER